MFILQTCLDMTRIGYDHLQYFKDKQSLVLDDRLEPDIQAGHPVKLSYKGAVIPPGSCRTLAVPLGPECRTGYPVRSALN